MVPRPLPIPLTSFVGRRRELAAVLALLEERRLVTLVGAPGVGKTRLALEAASAAHSRFEDGVWLIELAPLADPSLLPQMVADALGIDSQPGRSLSEMLADVLRPRRALLVLDNCEHLVGAVASLAETLLRACPRLQCLTTSREPLAAAGEVTWRVPSLAIPPDNAPPSGAAPDDETLRGFEAVRLFVDRARDADPAFALIPENAAMVARICTRLDGIPLALELAALRLRALSVDEIAARLDDRFRLLTGGSRTALPRQQTLRGAVDWSYGLLGEPERVLLRRLAVFAGSFTLEAAGAVCGEWSDDERSRGQRRAATQSSSALVANPSILDALVSLVEKSLVQTDDGEAGARRYRLLATFRQYGLERLDEAGELTRLRRHHRDYFLALAEQTKPELHGPAQNAAKERIARDYDEHRTALGWCVEEGLAETDPGSGRAGRPVARAAETGLRLGAALTWFWFLVSRQGEGRHWLERLLALRLPLDAPARRAVRAEALYGLALMHAHHGDHRLAIPLMEEALDLFRALGDMAGTARLTSHLGQYLGVLGHYERAVPLCDEGLALARGTGDPRVLMIGLYGSAQLAFQRGELERSAALSTERARLCRELGNAAQLTYSLGLLGRALTGLGRHHEAAACLAESLQVAEAVGNVRAVADACKDLGNVAIADGDAVGALVAHRRGLRIYDERGDRWGMASCLRGVARANALLATRGASSAGRRHRRSADRVPGRDGDDTVTASVRGVRLLGAVHSLNESLRIRLPATMQRDFDHDLARLRERLGEEAFAGAWETGRSMPLEQAVAEALASGPAGAAHGTAVVDPSSVPCVTATACPLSRRERQVAVLIARGLTNRRAADELGLSERTIDAHLRNIMGKLGVRSRAQVAAWVAKSEDAPLVASPDGPARGGRDN